MPKASAVKTVSALKTSARQLFYAVCTIVMLGVVALLAFIPYMISRQAIDGRLSVCAFRVPIAADSRLDFLKPAGAKQCVELEKSVTAEERTRGLSGRSFLAADRGMAFLFETSGTQCMWMKDMQFSIDIIWLDEQRQIVEIEENVSPDTYPDSFCNRSPARYVVEVNAGVVRKAGLRIGQQLYL